VKTALAKPGMESAAAKENADNLATDDKVVLVPELSHPVHRSAKKPNNM
jgi:hypothetical protein